MTTAPDVVIVGGGPIGLSTAWRAARCGLDVTMCDPEPASGASDVAAGMLAAVSEAWFGEEDLTTLTVESAQRWPRFAKELEDASGLPVGFNAGRTLLVAYDADDREVVDRLVGLQHELGLDAERCRGSELRRSEPALTPQVRGGASCGSDHRVDPRQLCQALLAACEHAGVTIHRERVTRVQIDGSQVAGVATDSGRRIAAGAVLLAAGVWSGAIEGLPPHVTPPVRPVRGEVVTVRVPDGMPRVLSHTIRGYVQGQTVYLVPRDDGRVVIGATSEERGFDIHVTAGGVYRLLRDASALVPGIDELEIVELRAGLRPGTPDNAPIIGHTEIGGLVVATGHYRNGILLTPFTADTVSDLIAGGAPSELLRPCDPGRFA